MIIIGCDYKREYIEKYGEHFNEKLAEFAIRHLKNVDGTNHRWSMEDIIEAFKREKLSLPDKESCMTCIIWPTCYTATGIRRQ